MTRALVTGISGQDGGYLAERLLADGVEVHALHHAAEGPPAHCPPEVVLHPGDLTDADGTRRLLLDLAPDQVYNLAALSSVAGSWNEPDLTFAVNGTAAESLMGAALEVQRRTHRPVHFVQASSAEIFGEPTTSPQDEATPIRPVNPYGRAKAHAHASVARHRALGLQASALILYPHESPRRPSHFVTRKVTSTVVAIAAGRESTLVLGNLDARRDWGWAPDYVDAMVRAAGATAADDYVVATGESHTVWELVASAARHAGLADWEGRVVSDPALARPTDAPELRGNPARALARLGWAPTVGFDELVGRMVAADKAGQEPPTRP